MEGDKDFTTSEILEHLGLFKKHEYLYVQEWVEYNSNDTMERAAQYKISLFGVDGKYKVEYRLSSDSIFEIKRGKSK